jgi:hypothetical protein
MADFLYVFNAPKLLLVTKPVALLLACLAALLLMSCGAAPKKRAPRSSTAPSSGTAGSSTAKPRYSPQKRRYLANFHTDCASANKLAEDSTAQLQGLIDQIGRGDVKTVPRLIAYLDHLAGGFQASLRAVGHLGAPPDPDSKDAKAYFHDAALVIAAIRRLSSSVARVQKQGIQAAISQLTTATTAAQTAAKRYGIPVCPTSPSKASHLRTGLAI